MNSTSPERIAMNVSSAQLAEQAVALTRTAIEDLEMLLDNTRASDWTNLQGAENDLLAALVKVRIAKQGVLRRDPSFWLPTLGQIEADFIRALGETLDQQTAHAAISHRGPRHLSPTLVAQRRAKMVYEAADQNLTSYVKRHGRPGTISGEKMTREQIRGYQQLLADLLDARQAFDKALGH
jgi:hypothetical protein